MLEGTPEKQRGVRKSTGYLKEPWAVPGLESAVGHGEGWAKVGTQVLEATTGQSTASRAQIHIR